MKVLDGLNDEQSKAATAPMSKTCVVLAGPGSGKTRVLTHRLAWMIKSRRVDPSKIVTVTFSRRAANEIAERAIKLCHRVDVNQICTIHAFCFRLLKSWGDGRKRIADWKVRQVIERHCESMNWNVGFKPVKWWIDEAKMSGIYVQERAEEFFFASLYNEMQSERIASCFAAVASFLENENAITFPDMVCDVWKLLQKKKYLNDARERFKYALVDEGQDTFRLAVEILTTIVGAKFFIVGDSDQTLFRFTGATPEKNLFSFSEARVYKLEKNYRSHPDIVKSANRLIEANYVDEAKKKFKKSLKPVSNAQGIAVEYRSFETPQDEALSVSQEIRDMIDRGKLPSSFFVASRMNAQLSFIGKYLAIARIPFVELGSVGFFNRKHIKIVIGYVQLINNVNDDNAFEVVYNVASNKMANHSGQYIAHRYLGHKFLQECSESGTSLWDGMAAIQHKRFSRGIKDFREFIEDVSREKRPGLSIKRILDECFVKQYLVSTGRSDIDPSDDDNVIEDVRTLVTIASDYDDIDEFLGLVDEMQSYKNEEDEIDSSVVLSTVHKLKGLERDVVFCIGWSEGILPHAYALGLINENAKMQNVETVLTPNRSSVVDERCIAFVALTRAKKQARISSIKQWNGKELSPSRFIAEMRDGASALRVADRLEAA